MLSSGTGAPAVAGVAGVVTESVVVASVTGAPLSVSPSTFGHTGYTGTGVWADPENKIVYIFLSDRVHPEGGTNTKLLTMNVRGKIQDALYKVLLEK